MLWPGRAVCQGYKSFLASNVFCSFHLHWNPQDRVLLQLRRRWIAQVCCFFFLSFSGSFISQHYVLKTFHKVWSLANMNHWSWPSTTVRSNSILLKQIWPSMKNCKCFWLLRHSRFHFHFSTVPVLACVALRAFYKGLARPLPAKTEMLQWGHR